MDGDITTLRREIEEAAKTCGITGSMKLRYLEAAYKLGDPALDEAINYLSSLKNPSEQAAAQQDGIRELLNNLDSSVPPIIPNTGSLQQDAIAVIEYLSKRGLY